MEGSGTGGFDNVKGHCQVWDWEAQMRAGSPWEALGIMNGSVRNHCVRTGVDGGWCEAGPGNPGKCTRPDNAYHELKSDGPHESHVVSRVRSPAVAQLEENPSLPMRRSIPAIAGWLCWPLRIN